MVNKVVHVCTAYAHQPRSPTSPVHTPRSQATPLPHCQPQPQDCLGDAICMDMLSGRNPYLFAALKSLPLLGEGEDLYAAHAAAQEASASKRPLDNATAAQLEGSKRAARLLLLQAKLELQGGGWG